MERVNTFKESWMRKGNTLRRRRAEHEYFKSHLFTPLKVIIFLNFLPKLQYCIFFFLTLVPLYFFYLPSSIFSYFNRELFLKYSILFTFIRQLNLNFHRLRNFFEQFKISRFFFVDWELERFEILEILSLITKFGR